MKTSQLLLVTAGALFLSALPARALEFDTLLDQPAGASGSHQRGGRKATPVKGLQLASGLQMSGPLNGSGPAPVAARLSDEDWRKVFVRKDPAK